MRGGRRLPLWGQANIDAEMAEAAQVAEGERLRRGMAAPPDSPRPEVEPGFQPDGTLVVPDGHKWLLAEATADADPVGERRGDEVTNLTDADRGLKNETLKLMPSGAYRRAASLSPEKAAELLKKVSEAKLKANSDPRVLDLKAMPGTARRGRSWDDVCKSCEKVDGSDCPLSGSITTPW